VNDYSCECVVDQLASHSARPVDNSKELNNFVHVARGLEDGPELEKFEIRQNAFVPVPSHSVHGYIQWSMWVKKVRGDYYNLHFSSIHWFRPKQYILFIIIYKDYRFILVFFIIIVICSRWLFQLVLREYNDVYLFIF